jgi:hypothetical protein
MTAEAFASLPNDEIRAEQEQLNQEDTVLSGRMVLENGQIREMKQRISEFKVTIWRHADGHNEPRVPPAVQYGMLCMRLGSLVCEHFNDIYVG